MLHAEIVIPWLVVRLFNLFSDPNNVYAWALDVLILTPFFSAICGSRPSLRISSGSVAPQGAWPWQAMLRFTIYDRAMFCGGSLILPQWVLTTAYCVYGKKASNIFVR